jgi:hypothetical protein
MSEMFWVRPFAESNILFIIDLNKSMDKNKSPGAIYCVENLGHCGWLSYSYINTVKLWRLANNNNCGSFVSF